jgi:hypothetical protein
MHTMSNLNKFKDSYQVFEKTLGLCFKKNKSSKTHKECLNNFFWPKIFTTNILYANVYKGSECDKNKMSYCTMKNFKKSNFLGFWAIDKTWPALDKFCYFHILKWKNRYLRCLHKIWNKIISLDRKKKVKCKTCHNKSEEKGEFGRPKNESL